MKRIALALAVVFGCAHSESSGPSSTPEVEALSSAPTPKPYTPTIEEQHFHFDKLTQLTFGGENAEAYWAFSGKELTLQARKGDARCDRIYRMDVATGATVPVSSGQGATTCSYFFPGDKEVLYASTMGGGPECPPRPDMSQGYVWALYDTYDIYKANADGTNVRPLTQVKGYDAEATVCPKDGSIIFTSTRDDDIELYRMDADGKNVKRLTHTPGYDGGAFFNHDCSKIVWRASRPKPGKELEDFQRLLKIGLVRPTKLELYVANADGSEATQVTYLNAASFAPFWHPTKDRILFSSNVADPKGRDFDIFAINSNGTALERITFANGFDGFPMFSPDGTKLAFSSNRATPPGQHDTNVFVADWKEGDQLATEVRPPDLVMKDVSFLAAPEQEGRGVGTKGQENAAAYLEKRFEELGMTPAGDNGTFRQKFPETVEVKAASSSAVEIGGAKLAADAFTPMGFSADGDVKGEVVFANYGIKMKDSDDYAGLNVKGKIVVVRRFVPESEAFSSTDAQRRFGDIRYKAWVAKEAGAKALVVVDWPVVAAKDGKPGELPQEAKLPKLRPEGAGDAGIPVVVVTRDSMKAFMGAPKKTNGRVAVKLEKVQKDAFNIVGKLAASSPEARTLPTGVVVVGAHYDHLGFGGQDSLAPESHEAHLGADDNASGVAGVMEAARLLFQQRTRLRRDVYFVAFAGEELGVLGSTAFTRTPPSGVNMTDVIAMLNLDMVGRLRENRLSILGVASGEEWRGILEPACELARVDCNASGDGYGPSDHTPFYAAGVPVLHFFTGAHSDYHKPSDTPDRINAGGLAQVAAIVAEVAATVSHNDARITYRNVPAPAPMGDLRSFNASLGTVPDYAPPEGTKGVLLAGVRAGGAAEAAGMKRGDVLVRLGSHEIGNVEDLMYALNASKPGETVTATVMRDGKEVKIPVTFQEGKRR
ncbi:MAG: M28 family peptidase [Myxococcaceae bacterium]